MFFAACLLFCLYSIRDKKCPDYWWDVSYIRYVLSFIHDSLAGFRAGGGGDNFMQYVIFLLRSFALKFPLHLISPLRYFLPISFSCFFCFFFSWVFNVIVRFIIVCIHMKEKKTPNILWLWNRLSNWGLRKSHIWGPYRRSRLCRILRTFDVS